LSWNDYELQQSLISLGFDSLMIMELKNRILTDLGVDIPIRKLISRNTILQLVELLVEHFSSLDQISITVNISSLPLAPIARSNNLPLSLNQERLWLLAKFTPNSSVYNFPVAFRLDGLLDIAALEQSIQEIVRRHEILRTTILVDNRNPVQVISDNIDFTLLVIDLQNTSESNREIEAQRLVTEETQQSFNLTQGTLWRIKLLRLTEINHILILTMHHIISDGWSINIIFKELTKFYEAFSTGKSLSFPELSLQYADFAACQRQWLQSNFLKLQLDYWTQQLNGALLPLELPIDRPRSRSPKHQGAYKLIVLSTYLTKKIKILSEQEGVTLFMTLLSAFKSLLYYYSQQEDIIICSPIACRNREETKQLIGYFNNIVVMRTDLSGNPSFRELIIRVHKIASEAYEHQELPFQIIAELPNLVRIPLSRCLFVLQNTPSHDLYLPEVKVSSLTVHNGMANFDLSLSLTEENEQIRGILDYKTDLFDEVTINGILETFQTILENIVITPEQSLEELLSLTKAKISHQNIAYLRSCTNQEKPLSGE